MNSISFEENKEPGQKQAEHNKQENGIYHF